jgi:hypothetical protein
MGDQSVTRPLPTQKTTQIRNKHTQTSMFRVGLEPRTPAFQGVNTVHDLDGAATLLGPPVFSVNLVHVRKDTLKCNVKDFCLFITIICYIVHL